MVKQYNKNSMSKIINLIMSNKTYFNRMKSLTMKIMTINLMKIQKCIHMMNIL